MDDLPCCQTIADAVVLHYTTLIGGGIPKPLAESLTFEFQTHLLVQDMHDDFEAQIKMLANEVKRFSSCTPGEPVVSTRAQRQDEGLAAVGKSILKRLDEVGIAQKV